jgi:hypothetical protein
MCCLGGNLGPPAKFLLAIVIKPSILILFSYFHLLMGGADWAMTRRTPRSGFSHGGFFMFLINTFRKWLQRISRPVVKDSGKSKRRSSFRLQLEALEDRLAPANAVWTGALNNLWSSSPGRVARLFLPVSPN